MFGKLLKPKSVDQEPTKKPAKETNTIQEPAPASSPVIPPESPETGKIVRDKMFNEAARLAVGLGYASTHLLQTKMKIGHTHAKRLISQLEKEGIVASQVENKARAVLMTPEKLEVFLGKAGQQQAEI
ncbi:MAG TPA: DNA translocase FtsK [Chitinivibrionales bacterium]|nr:DNA translocase FtsK [Chitinivibrionales bacterium]